ncbi:DUF1559 domain-containing protein [bacterium]|nr:DUF1559 domain-containing protein [bacterium]
MLAAMLLPALARAREQARRGVCLANLKQLGLVLNIYAQDWGGWFPILEAREDQPSESKTNRSLALLTGQTIPVDAQDDPHPALETPAYITDYQLFICPSSRCQPNDIPGMLNHKVVHNTSIDIPGSCSYAYAYGLNLQTHSDTAIMADTKGYYGTQWNWQSTHDTRSWQVNEMDHHSYFGVNVLYVGGNAKWVNTTKLVVTTSNNFHHWELNKNALPNCGPGNEYTLRDLYESY